MKTILSAIFTAAVACAAAPPIGMVTASGHFTLQGSQVWGNATLFDGAVVETGPASSQLALRSGVKVQLGPGSRAQVFSDRLLLERGAGQVSGLLIRGQQPDARVRIGLGPRIEVAALAGVARVIGAADVTLASIPAGRSMLFAPQAGQGASFTRAGCLLYKDNHFILQDDNTQEVVELNGQDLAANVGNRIEVTGTASAARPAVTTATSVMNVTALSPRSQGGCLVVASNLQAQTEMPRAGAPAAAGAASNAPAPAGKTGGGGMSTGAKVAIVAVVAGGGAGAAIALAGGKKSTSP